MVTHNQVGISLPIPQKGSVSRIYTEIPVRLMLIKFFTISHPSSYFIIYFKRNHNSILYNFQLVCNI